MLCDAAARASRGVRVVVVDASPDPAIRAAMSDAGAHAVREQTAKGRKGAALREALGLAAGIADARAPGDERAGGVLLCWQEPEKADMPRHWPAVLRAADRARADVIVPARARALFRRTYPLEQFHSESYANLYLDCAARAPRLRGAARLALRPVRAAPAPRGGVARAYGRLVGRAGRARRARRARRPRRRRVPRAVRSRARGGGPRLRREAVQSRSEGDRRVDRGTCRPARVTSTEALPPAKLCVLPEVPYRPGTRHFLHRRAL